MADSWMIRSPWISASQSKSNSNLLPVLRGRRKEVSRPGHPLDLPRLDFATPTPPFPPLFPPSLATPQRSSEDFQQLGSRIERLSEQLANSSARNLLTCLTTCFGESPTSSAQKHTSSSHSALAKLVNMAKHKIVIPSPACISKNTLNNKFSFFNMKWDWREECPFRWCCLKTLLSLFFLPWIAQTQKREGYFTYLLRASGRREMKKRCFLPLDWALSSSFVVMDIVA